MHRLQPVAHVGQRAGDDDTHRVVDKRLLQLFFDKARKDPFAAVGSGHSGSRLERRLRRWAQMPQMERNRADVTTLKSSFGRGFLQLGEEWLSGCRTTGSGGLVAPVRRGAVMDARARGNTKLVLLGVVISAVDKRTSLANSLSDFVEKTFKAGENTESVKFRTSIGRSTVIPQTQKAGRTLFETHSTHKLTDEYRSLAVEIEDRLQKIEGVTVQVPAQEVVNG